MWWLGGVPWGIEGVNRCRSYLRYQKTKKLKISNFGLTHLIQMWAVESTRSSYLHYTALFSMKGVSPISAFRVNEENVQAVFFQKKDHWVRRLRRKKEGAAMSTQWQGRGGGRGRENFEKSLPWNAFSLQQWVNSIALCPQTIHYNKALFSTQWSFVLYALSAFVLFHTLFLEGEKSPR